MKITIFEGDDKTIPADRNVSSGITKLKRFEKDGCRNRVIHSPEESFRRREKKTRCWRIFITLVKNYYTWTNIRTYKCRNRDSLTTEE